MGSSLFGKDPSQVFQQMVAFIRQQRWADALELGQTLLDMKRISSEDRGMVLNNMGICHHQLR